MGYLHIDNLYKDQRILLFKECYALEKVHGQSASIGWDGTAIPRDHALSYDPGGLSEERFRSLFSELDLFRRMAGVGHLFLTVYGEVYGAGVQKMKAVYGEELGFVAFDVQIGDLWLAVPDAEEIVVGLGLEFVPYRKIPTDMAAIDAERDRTSALASRRGMGTDKEREGIILRPPVEVRFNNDARVIAKYKREKYEERMQPPKVADPARLQVLAEARAIADEWVTPMRLTHVLDKLPGAVITQTRQVIEAMVADVYREAAGEIVESKDATNAIGKKTAELFKAHLKEQSGC